MTLHEGNRVKNILSGKAYQVKKITKDWVLLQVEGGSSQLLTGKMSLRFMFAWEGVEEESPNIIPLFPGLGPKVVEAGGVSEERI